MDELKETAVCLMPKEHLAFMKDDSGFIEHIVNSLSTRLADRIMGILEREEEIIVRQSDLRVSEYLPTNSVEYRRQINWSPLVRCKDCKCWDRDYEYCVDFLTQDKNGFCSWWERRE